MKKTKLVLTLLSLSCAACFSAEVPAKIEKSSLDGLYVEALGIMRKPNITGKSEYGAGAEIGLQLNKSVAIGIQNIAYATPDNWGGGAIDETSGVAHWTLFTAKNKKTRFGGIGQVTYGWSSDAWAIGAGAELRHNFTKKASAGISGVIRFWNDGDSKEDLLLAASLGYKF